MGLCVWYDGPSMLVYAPVWGDVVGGGVCVMLSFQHLLNHCLVCDNFAIHLMSFRFLACWCLRRPLYGVHLQWGGCVVPWLYISLNMLVIFCVTL